MIVRALAEKRNTKYKNLLFYTFHFNNCIDFDMFYFTFCIFSTFFYIL